MLTDSITMLPGAEITNARIESGPTFPISPISGRMFYLSVDIDEFTPIGLYVYDGNSWNTSGVGPGGATGAVGPTGPTGPQGDIGVTGPTGATGIDGINGIDGIDGVPGSVWRRGSGIPIDTSGIDGDYYLNVITGDVYLKTLGTYANIANILGPTGPTGADGVSGIDGIDGVTGPTGPTGPTGSAGVIGSIWRNGVGVPSNTLGANGDYYLNNSTGDVYLRTAGIYNLTANIKGADGSSGDIIDLPSLTGNVDFNSKYRIAYNLGTNTLDITYIG